ncbi:MAG TPA: CRTAC1 family protein [Vicinamibacterales bacterium]|nr:CRTAC1 family protein [Vicinamibacterales bacterium]
MRFVLVLALSLASLALVHSRGTEGPVPPAPDAAAARVVPADASGPIRFDDVAEEAGLDFRLENHPTPDKHLPETMPGGVATLDYDGDGLTDIYFTNGAEMPSREKSSPKYWNRLYRNEGGLRFRDVTEAAGVAGAGYSMGVAAADYDNDGDVDLFVAGLDRNILYRNTGKSAFEDVTARAGIASRGWAVAAGWFDYDNDGRLDLFVVNYLEWAPGVDPFCGDRARGLRVYCHPKFYEGLPNTLYRNRGDGTFEDVSERSGIGRHVGKGMSVAFADYDDNGFLDAFVTNDAVPSFLFRNRGGGTFEEVALLAGAAVPGHGRPVSAMGVDFRDYDNDGRPDIVFTALAGETFPLFANDGRGGFRDATHASGLGAATMRRSGWGVGLVDLDNDGWKDLFTANSHVNDRIELFEASEYRQANSVFRNLGDGRFQDVSSGAGADFQTARAHRGNAFADFDGDGRLDVVTTALGERAQLWRNTSPAGNWIRLRLVGTRSNRDGIGAVVRIGTRTDLMTTSVGYASSSHHGVHIGLGRAEVVDRIEIRWPSGARQVLERVPVNRELRIEEQK